MFHCETLLIVSSGDDEYRPSYRNVGSGRLPSPIYPARAEPFVRDIDEERDNKIPSGPRHYPPHDPPLLGERGIPHARDVDRREPRSDRLAKEVDSGRRTGRYPDEDQRREDYPPRRENGTRPMDVDIPVTSPLVDVPYVDISRSSGAYGERPDVRKDATPTGPRAMSSKSSGPLPPQPPFGPKGSGSSRFAPQDNGWPVRERPPAGGQRPSRFGEVQRPDERRSPPVTRDTADRQGAPERPVEPVCGILACTSICYSCLSVASSRLTSPSWAETA